MVSNEIEDHLWFYFVKFLCIKYSYLCIKKMFVKYFDTGTPIIKILPYPLQVRHYSYSMQGT